MIINFELYTKIIYKFMTDFKHYFIQNKLLKTKIKLNGVLGFWVFGVFGF